MYWWLTAAQAHRRVPHERGLAEQLGRVEVEVGLGVGGDDPRSHRQEGGVGHGGRRRGSPDPPVTGCPSRPQVVWRRRAAPEGR